MKILLRRNVSKLGKIGEVVDVKAGYARNYLIPHRLAIEPTAGNLQAVEAEKAAYLAQMVKLKAELEVKAAALNGKEVTIQARANAEGHLYGSIGPAQIAEALANAGIFVEPEHIVLVTPIKLVDRHEVVIQFPEDVAARITVIIAAVRDAADIEAEEAAAASEAKAERESDSAE